MTTDEFVVLDFETTGLSPQYARVIEVGAALVKGTEVVDTISQLLYPGCRIPYFITQITGITDQMVRGKPAPETFMPTLKNFIANRPIIAHNATFDQKFLVSELGNIGEVLNNQFLCTLKLARRLVHGIANYKLTTLVSHLKLKVSTEHKAHRALDDVMATVQLWFHMKQYVASYIEAEPALDLFLKLENQPKTKILKFLESQKMVLFER